MLVLYSLHLLARGNIFLYSWGRTNDEGGDSDERENSHGCGRRAQCFRPEALQSRSKPGNGSNHALWPPLALWLREPDYHCTSAERTLVRLSANCQLRGATRQRYDRLLQRNQSHAGRRRLGGHPQWRHRHLLHRCGPERLRLVEGDQGLRGL